MYLDVRITLDIVAKGFLGDGTQALRAIGAAIKNEVGTTRPCAKLTGDSGSGFEAAFISDCRLFPLSAEN